MEELYKLEAGLEVDKALQRMENPLGRSRDGMRDWKLCLAVEKVGCRWLWGNEMAKIIGPSPGARPRVFCRPRPWAITKP